MLRDEFDHDYFRRLDAVRAHWWVVGMQKAALALLGEPPEESLQVLDAGCGVGTNIPWLAPFAGSRRIQAMDIAPAAVAACHRSAPRTDVVRASVTELPYPDGVFDLVTSMDVLQHLTASDAARAVKEMFRVLRPGGRVLVRTNAAFGRAHVPQREDWRLYTPGLLRAELEQAGFSVARLTPVNFVQGAWASLPRPRRGHPTHTAPTEVSTHHGLGIPHPTGRVKNRLLLGLVNAEATWLRGSRRRLPLGHSLYALATRPSG
jgi:SAM-dependent methyltransferase